ncbi:hypothetical protein MSG28_008188 [Choristoneura fumiferana]|uniref:Uncharacterized protein n=1 Tax=Choristoneura fumiferana TaxID=7141 RepID=A0ACC0JAM6_CHOFU|nr:hypothetical protein MSG28_008188 [Choristoneura fumiferana]
MLDGFTYSFGNKTKRGEHYYCSSRTTSGCRAKVWRLELDGYTYSQINNTTHWLCSSKMQGCKARLRRSGDDIFRINTQHTHPPPRYICKNGAYIKV